MLVWTIFTDIAEYSKNQILKLAPLHRNDHCCLLLPSAYRKKHRFEYKLKHIINESTKSRLGLILSKQSWESVLRCDNVNPKVEKFHNIMDDILNDVSPLKRIRVRKDDPQWITPLIRKIRNCKIKHLGKDVNFINILKCSYRN